MGEGGSVGEGEECGGGGGSGGGGDGSGGEGGGREKYCLHIEINNNN